MKKNNIINMQNLPAFNYKMPILPMLLKSESKPFNNRDWIFELKLDGFRCIVVCDNKTVLYSRNGNIFNKLFPELLNIHKLCSCPCILDGEIVYINNAGVPDFFALQKRRAMSNSNRIKNSANNQPVTFVAFDMLTLNNKDLTKLPLITRKQILQQSLTESTNVFISRYIENLGIDFFNATKEKQLEGIVAKKKNSLYHIGKRRDDWLKIKSMPHQEYRQQLKKL